ncbi:MAG: SWIM zinc finger family protein [Acidobacteria bacterium]|nr:SWIM zinc finger family protein [Acidobacteriota bacterium]
MRPEERQPRDTRATDEVFVIARGPDGFRVHAPQNGRTVYVVGPDLNSPTCTCPDFDYHRTDPDWRCKHVLAVQSRFAAPAPPETVPPAEDEERAAIQEEGKPTRRRRAPHTTNGSAAQMLLKRSISPDGRIDSLSVEFSCPVEPTRSETEGRAEAILALQAGIIGRFLAGNGEQRAERSAPAPRPAAPPPAQSGMPAMLLRIDGMDGKWGRRLYILIQSNGQTLRLFGNPKQLADAIAAAGFPDRAGTVAEGVRLDLLCRIVTQPSPDGRFQNVEQVLPLGPAPRRSP